MRLRIDQLDTPGGHIVVALLVFLVGVVMIVLKLPKGDEIVAGALACLYTSLRNAKGNS